MYTSFQGAEFERHEPGLRDRAIALVIIVAALAILVTVALILTR
jgi:hypothetical protein